MALDPKDSHALDGLMMATIKAVESKLNGLNFDPDYAWLVLMKAARVSAAKTNHVEDLYGCMASPEAKQNDKKLEAQYKPLRESKKD